MAADKLFCLDIHKDTVTAVVVDKSSTAAIVTGCSSVEIEEQSFEDAINQLKEQTGFTGGPCLVTFGVELFSFKNVSLPFSDRKKIEQTLPFELADLAPVDVNSLLIDFIVTRTGPKGADIVAAMISREYLATHLSFLNSAGISPDSIGISGFSTALILANGGEKNFLLLDIGSYWASLFVVFNGQVALIRSLAIQSEAEDQTSMEDAFVLNIKQTILASRLLDMQNPNYCVYLTGLESRGKSILNLLTSSLGDVEIKNYKQSTQPFIKINPDISRRYQSELMDRILASALKSRKKSGGFNFRKDDFRKKRSLQEYRHLALRVGLPLIVVIASVIVYMGYEYSNLTSEHESLQSQITEVFKETLPEVRRIVNPVQQLQVVNNKMRATYRPGGDSGSAYTILELLTELSVRIPASNKVKVLRMVADMNTIRLKAVTGDFNTVDNVQKDLEKSPYFTDVTISSANQSMQGDEVNFELKLELARL